MPAKVKKGAKEVEKDDRLHAMRHSLAHVLEQAVLKLWPKTKYSIGPPIDTGCYHDFLFEDTITPEDFPKLEKIMRGIIREGQTFERRELTVAEAKAYWRKLKQPFKVEMIEDLEKTEGALKVTNYANIRPNGEEAFVDLCRGGHVENTKGLPIDGFKITHLAGAYWRGDEKREQLTRVYVAAFPTKEELQKHLRLQELAKERDHRQLGRELEIFVISDVVGPGLPMLAPAGAIIRQELEGWIRGELKCRGYSFVYTPHIGRAELYKTSGHLSHFQDSIYPLIEAEDSAYVLKPMNCPHHVEIYRSSPRSYRDLPLRFAEFGTVYRYEKSGEVGGLTRVRGFTQDDAHHFIRPEQLQEEVVGILDLSFHIYRTLGFEDFTLRLSLHDPKDRKKYIGGEENWKHAEEALCSALKSLKLEFVEAIGEAAFYGPKIDLIVRDVLQREWQLGTIPQVDYNMPERFDLSFTDDHGHKQRPIMLHRAIVGSFERFIGLLIEHFGGLFPLWLAPIQVLVLPIAPPHQPYANRVFEELRKRGVRVDMSSATETLGKRIREGEQRKIPYLLVVGEREASSGSVAVRSVKTKKQVTLPVEQFCAMVTEDIRVRKLDFSI